MRDNIAYSMKEALASWGLPEEQQFCIIMDIHHASNMMKAPTVNKW